MNGLFISLAKKYYYNEIQLVTQNNTSCNGYLHFEIQLYSFITCENLCGICVKNTVKKRVKNAHTIYLYTKLFFSVQYCNIGRPKPAWIFILCYSFIARFYTTI